MREEEQREARRGSRLSSNGSIMQVSSTVRAMQSARAWMTAAAKEAARRDILLLRRRVVLRSDNNELSS